jgi:UDPglucose 6-dehydrogenase
LLGFAFKPNTDDLRDAPSLDIARQLIRQGARVTATDPVALDNARRYYPDLGVIYCAEPLVALKGADAIVLVTEWPEYSRLNWTEIKPMLNTPLILDGRNFLDRHELVRLGFRYVGVGR